MKKIFALLLALTLALSLSAMAFAAEANLSGHEYKAYQIFAGTQTTTDGESNLGNIEWGNGVNGTNLLAELKKLNAYKDCADAMDVAEVLSDVTDDSAAAKEFAAIAYKFIDGDGVKVTDSTSFDAGYYLVVDVTTPKEGEENFVYNLALLQLTKKGTFDIQTKVDIPTIVKTVDDVNDSTGATGTGKTADYDIGDNVPFTITAQLATISDYDSYYVKITDTMSSGLEYDNNASIKMYASGDTDGIDVTEKFIMSGPTNGVITWECDNVKAEGIGAGNNTKFVINYTATLSSSAAIGAVGNTNKAKLTYSNNPNDIGTGDTPEDTVIVFTYELDATKYANSVAEANKLTGAAFTIWKFTENPNGTDKFGTGEAAINGTWAEYKAMTVDSEDGAKFSLSGLDDGKYKIVESTTPNGYNTMDDIEFTITAVHDDTTKKVTNLEVSPNTFTVVMTEATETEAAAPTGVIKTDIINNSGAVLPETGGIGTTIFYIVGSVLVVAAAIVLFAKKRVQD